MYGPARRASPVPAAPAAAPPEPDAAGGGDGRRCAPSPGRNGAGEGATVARTAGLPVVRLPSVKRGADFGAAPTFGLMPEPAPFVAFDPAVDGGGAFAGAPEGGGLEASGRPAGAEARDERSPAKLPRQLLPALELTSDP